MLGLRRILVLCIVLVVVLAGLCNPAVLQAQQGPAIKLKQTAVVDRLGDGRFTLELNMPAAMYTQAKANNPNTAVLLRRLGAGLHWAELEDVQGRFDDNTSTVVIQYAHRGLAKTVGEDGWELSFEENSQLELVGIFGNTAIFTTAVQTDLGMANVTVRLDAPAGSEDLQFAHGPPRLTYRLRSHAAGGNRPDARLFVEVKPQIMSCLAKSFADERFPLLWVARSVFKNTGDQTLKDYRVRFRISEYSAWSRWMRSDRILPGQTVVDAYFPVFDLEKLTQMTGARPAMLEVQYEFRQADGQIVSDSDSRRIKLLGRNQIVFSSLRPDEAVGFYDRFNYGPAILASFVTCDDPVVQQLGGRISQQAGGVAAASDDQDAVKFMEALYNFMSQSGISYQTPPNPLFEGQSGQHVKYGRDVLRNRAGTCIDLAILYASVCESVGLRPVLFLVPGHCFPAAYTPSGQLAAVESTMIGRATFQDAYQQGMKQAREAFESGLAYVVDVKQLHDLGVHSLDLPPVETDFLETLGYRFNQPTDRPRPPETLNNHDGSVAPPISPPDPRTAAALAGRWLFDGSVNGASLTMITVMSADGNYATYVKMSSPYAGTVEYQQTGTFEVQGGFLTIRPNDGTGVAVRQYEMQGNKLRIHFQELGSILVFQRA